MRLSRILVGAGVLAAVAGLSGLGAAPAQAAGGVEFSTDGTAWSSAPPAALFPAGPTLVPGGAISTTLWVRQMQGAPADVAVVLRNVQASSPALAAVATLSAVGAAGTSLAPTVLATLGACTPLVPAGVLASGAARSVTLTLSLPVSAGPDAADGSASFDVAVTATDPVAAPTADGCGPASGTASAVTRLASTGTSLGALGVAAVLGALGVLLIALVRRRRPRASRKDEA